MKIVAVLMEDKIKQMLKRVATKSGRYRRKLKLRKSPIKDGQRQEVLDFANRAENKWTV